MLPAHLDWDDKDEDPEEFYLECLRFNIEFIPDMFFEMYCDKINEIRFVAEKPIKKGIETILVSFLMIHHGDKY